MKWLTLDRIKQNSRIDGDEENTLLTSYGESAETTLLNYLNRTYQNVIEEYGAMPEPLVQASLMLVDVWYNHRSPDSPVSMSMVPYTFDVLIKPYIRLAGGINEAGLIQTIPVGSDAKIEFTADLPDDLTLADVNFTGKVFNADAASTEMAFDKAGCIMVDDGECYVVLVDTDTLGIGTYLMRLTVQIPDTDYQTGYRREVINIDPHIRVTG